ncbi:helix-turn-helix domain-containing protein [Laribacter hongkongensis]|uniref:YdaS family helix-turn-helix protein n=1 Tax=Laribacter hongkongensis TaxID=168471 RepID=UPI00281FB395|nr:helix-turn-helix domain-containing protein [Laribacter hongkongensis]MCG9063303.1 helix-turn-helix domain-containing protein [Laribacter hongkongensis]
MNVQNTICRLVKKAGSQKKLACIAQVQQPTVHSWMKGRQQPGPVAAINIEAAGLGVTRYQLRDDAEKIWPRSVTES